MRSTILALASAAVLSSSSLAFKNTSPLLVWSSEPNLALSDAAEEISSGVIGADEVYGTVHGLGCDWETLMVVHVDQLHNSHLASRSLPYARKADMSIPYLLRPTRESLDSAVGTWAKLCGAEVVSDVTEQSGKSVVLLEVSKDDDLSSIQVPSSPHILLLTGTHPSVDQQKRQERPFPNRPSPASSSSSEASSPSSTSTSGSDSDRGNSTIPTGGPLLQRVQILTTPIITGFLITFLIFMPIIGFGIWSLAGIQVPPRMMEISKGMIVSKDKKDN